VEFPDLQNFLANYMNNPDEQKLEQIYSGLSLGKQEDDSLLRYFYLGQINSIKKNEINAELDFQKVFSSAGNNIGKHWFLQQQHKLLHNNDWVDIEEREIDKLRHIYNFKCIPFIAGYYLKQARDDASRGDLSSATKLCKAALKFDPSLASAHGLLIKIHLKERNALVIKACLRFIKTSCNNIIVQLLTMLNLSIFLGNAWKLFFICIFSIMVIKYFLENSHYFAEFLPRAIPVGLRGLFLLVFPVIFMMSKLPWILFGILLCVWLWKRAKLSAKVILILYLLLCMSIPFQIRLNQTLLYMLDTDNPVQLLRASERYGWNPQLESHLQIACKEESFASYMAYANMCKNRGDYDKAKRLYRAAIKKNRESIQAYIQYGNVHAYADSFLEARNQYRKALALNPNLPEVHYNTAVLKLVEEAKSKGDGEKPEKESKASNAIKKLSKLIDKEDMELGKFDRFPVVEAYRSKIKKLFGSSIPLQAKLIDKEFGNQELWRFMLAEQAETNKIRAKVEEIFRDDYLPIHSVLYIFLIILIIPTLFGLGSLFAKKGDRFCDSCGRPICDECYEDIFCPSCYSKLEDVADDMEKIQQKLHIQNKLEKREWVKSLFFNVLFPGSGWVYIDEELLGFIFMIMMSLAYSFLLSSSSFVFLESAGLFDEVRRVALFVIPLMNLWFLILFLKDIAVWIRGQK
jgi:tetratricopeptide (TPR) repeat protein